MSSDVDIYLAALPPDQHAALTSLRACLQTLLPDHLECLSYAMPGFRQPGAKGKMVVGYAAFAKHLGLYPHSGNIIPALADQCSGYKTSKSGILFTPDHPLPPQLITLIVQKRQEEIARIGR